MAKIIKVRCVDCNKIFSRPLGRFNEAIKFGWNQFCSNKCQFKYRARNRKILLCENCGKKFERELSSISQHNYCSHSCAMIINNKKYPRKHLPPILKSCVQCKVKYKKSTNNKKYCSMKCRIIAENYTYEGILNIIKNFVKKFKRIPTKRELIKIDKASRKFFGSWNMAITKAGFSPNRSHDDRMYKRSICKSNDGHICDSISELLIDNWLYKNNIIHEKGTRYPNTNHKADWQILYKNKMIFVEYFGLANDSPRYNRCIEEKEILCKKSNISLIGIFPKDIYPKENFENNLKNKFKKYL